MVQKTHPERCRDSIVVDLTDISVDCKAPVDQRLRSFVSQIGNPYSFKTGDVIIHVEYGSGKNLSDALTDILCAG